MEPIKNLEKYTNGMKKSLIDKIFFIDKISTPFNLLDFGCANGSLISFLSTLFNDENSYVGYDFDSKMLELANKDNNSEHVSFTSDYSHALCSVLRNGYKVLNLSSIIHEIYSYSSFEEIEYFWKNQVFSPKYVNFDYIVIRDMIPSSSINRESYINDVRKIYNKANQNLLNSFQNKWGSISNFKNMSHFLLKYRYTENWDRELVENYLPITVEDLLRCIPDNYDIIYSEHYCLPFLHEIIKKDFNIDFNEPIHFKMVLKRNENTSHSVRNFGKIFNKQYQ